MNYPKDPEEGQIIDLPTTLVFLKILDEGLCVGTIQSLNKFVAYDTERSTQDTTLECSGVRTAKQLVFDSAYEVLIQQHTHPRQIYTNYAWHPLGEAIEDSSISIDKVYIEDMRVHSISNSGVRYTRVTFVDKSPHVGTLVVPAEVGLKEPDNVKSNM
jgi:hypothetical protein